jgi:hypothetical protein
MDGLVEQKRASPTYVWAYIVSLARHIANGLWLANHVGPDLYETNRTLFFLALARRHPDDVPGK